MKNYWFDAISFSKSESILCISEEQFKINSVKLLGSVLCRTTHDV